jgi:flagella basal body P-ring formation protein FlgA
MPRTLLLVLCLALLSPAVMAQPALRGNIVIDGPTIRLGDLFSDAGAAADAAIASAPLPGTKIVYDAGWLAARAREQNLDWTPRSRYDQAIVERAGQAITADMIVGELKRELGNRLPQGKIRLELDNPGIRLFVSSGATPSIAIDNLAYNERNGRLSATVSAAGDDTAAEPLRVTGRVSRMFDLPVLTRPIAPGDAIVESDVQTIAVRADRMTETYVAEIAELVGKTPRRAIRPGEPVRPSDIQTPVIIHKGEFVNLVLRTPTMTLTAQVKALDDGGQGASIRVVNPRSGRTLDAIVVGTGLAAIPGTTGPVVATR